MQVELDERLGGILIPIHTCFVLRLCSLGLLFDDGGDAKVQHLLEGGHAFSLGVRHLRLWGGRNCWIRYLYLN